MKALKLIEISKKFPEVAEIFLKDMDQGIEELREQNLFTECSKSIFDFYGIKVGEDVDDLLHRKFSVKGPGFVIEQTDLKDRLIFIKDAFALLSTVDRCNGDEDSLNEVLTDILFYGVYIKPCDEVMKVLFGKTFNQSALMDATVTRMDSSSDMDISHLGAKVPKIQSQKS